MRSRGARSSWPRVAGQGAGIVCICVSAQSVGRRYSFIGRQTFMSICRRASMLRHLTCSQTPCLCLSLRSLRDKHQFAICNTQLRTCQRSKKESCRETVVQKGVCGESILFSPPFWFTLNSHPKTLELIENRCGPLLRFGRLLLRTTSSLLL